MRTVSVHLGTHNYATVVSAGSHQWVVDEPTDKGGGDKGPDPVAMLLASLGSCTAITIRMYAQRKGWEVQDIRVTMEIFDTTTGAEKGRSFGRVITVAGNLDEAQLQRLMQIGKACPVSKMLEGTINIDTTIKNSTDDHSAAG